MNGPMKIATGAALAGLLATGSLFGVARHLLSESFRGKLQADTSTRARIVQGKLEEAVLIAEAVAGFAQTAGEPDRKAFAAFTRQFLAEDTGLTALSLTAVVPGPERARFETKARTLSGKADFTVFEGVPGVSPEPLRDRGVYYPVLFTNTRDASAMIVIGFDLGSSPVRLAAMDRACDTAAVTVSGRITLFGTSGRPGFILFAPVYGTGRPTSSGAERRAALTGFIQAIFSPDDVIASALRTTTPVGLPFDLLDLSAPRERQVICGWAARLQPVATWRSVFIPAGIGARNSFSFAGREWGIDVHPNAAYLENNYPVVHWLILPVGLALTLLLAVYIFAVLSRRDERERLITELQQAQLNIRTLEGILPICSSCKKIRDEKDDWVQVESYVSRHTSAAFTHSICPDCVRKLYPDYAKRRERGDPAAG
jgi:CHASE1-domain containing sensor protein